MQITSLKYDHKFGTDSYLDINRIEFGKINLFVGKNASGKSKTLNLILGLSSILGDNKSLLFTDGNFDVDFFIAGKKYQYILKFVSSVVIIEKLIEVIEDKSKILIERHEDGRGFILSSNGNKHEFDLPQNELKVNRRDKTNYPYLEDLYDWARHVRMFNFSSSIGKSSLALKDPTKTESPFHLKNTDAGVIPTFASGRKLFEDKFKNKIIADFNEIGFDITDIDIGTIASVNLQLIQNPNTDVCGIRVKEKKLNCWTDHWDMSNGMFRALSLIIHFNYYELAEISGLILIDDIGEGLDFERSTKLIDLIIKKTEESKYFQVIMSTNDIFVMNSVDLKYWQIIDRDGCHINYYTYLNSEKTFKEYIISGLNHFDFFATNFYKNGFSNEE